MRALVIDNQLSFIEMVRQTLTPVGFTVDASHDSEDAHTQALTRDYDLMLLSLLLPGEQGFNLLRRLRRSGMSAPILAITASNALAERVRCLDLGADGYLTRPIEGVELAARARALVRRFQQDYDNVIRVNDLEIDAATRLVRRAGKTIRLTRREYALLYFLAARSGKVCSRALIWHHLYGGQAESRSNVVDVFIAFLRAKIDQGFGMPLIRTCWGKGYMLLGETTVMA